MDGLLTLEEAQARLLALANPLPVERVPVEEALERFLAEALIARRAQPAADLSAMDGYAMRAADLPGPWQVVGESAAGHPFVGTVGAGTAVRISTGAHLPAGADMVLLQEDALREGTALCLRGEPPVPADRHVRHCGADFSDGATLLAAGTRLGPAQLALAIGAGHNRLAVRRRPQVAILDCGDELAVDPAACLPHQIPASNGVMLAALAASLPCAIDRLGPVADRLDAVVATLDQASDADVVVTSGGVSVGDHDLLRPALETWGAELDFWKVGIKPGKPLLVARRGAQVIIGLPGNPVSSYVTAYLFVLPLLRALLGSATPLPRAIAVPTAEALPAGGNRREFLRAYWGGHSVSARINQDSGALATMAASNALIDRPIGAPAVPAGTMVPVYLLDGGASA
ncbi:MAG: hypothetical protein RIQ99_1515 [Pseudomonadota bacterium]|jgi:molybdopterin molybdotransferase